MDFEAPFGENRAAVARMIRQAKARGMEVLLIPHLWVETGGWRGEMDPGTEEGWRAYQASYRAFVLSWAELAAEAGADAFSIGVECKSWSGRFGDYWSGLIRDVRARFPGILTYSANWDEVDGVIFWDQLDLIGVNAFYPLSHHDDASYAEYLEGAGRARDGIHQVAQQLEMPVLFVEVGYTTRKNAAVQPWLWPDDMTDVVFDEHEQARALAALFETFLPDPGSQASSCGATTRISTTSRRSTSGASPRTARSPNRCSRRCSAGPGPPTVLQLWACLDPDF